MIRRALLILALLPFAIAFGCTSDHATVREETNKGVHTAMADVREYYQSIAGVPNHFVPDLRSWTDEQRQAWLQLKLAPLDEYDAWYSEDRKAFPLAAPLTLPFLGGAATSQPAAPPPTTK